MKLAREIAEAVYREQKDIRDRFGVELGKATIEGIIASMLGPMREVMVECAVHCDGLALFEEAS